MIARIERVAVHIPGHTPVDDFYVIDPKGKIITDRSGKGRIFKLDGAQGYVGRYSESESTRDIFNSIPMTEGRDVICIVGPGKNGKGHYAEIPPEAYVIAVNKGIECPVDGGFDLWMVADSSSVNDQWWIDNAEIHRDILCMPDNYDNLDRINPRHTFKINPAQITEHDADLSWGSLRTGCTITAMALQVAYYMRPKRIILIGIDMSGDVYYDGTRAHYTQRADNKVWNVTGRINALIRYICKDGIVVKSLSETAIALSMKPAGMSIWQTGLRFSGDVYIVGTGPRGKAHYGDIPHDARVIVVNAAINIMGIPKMLWMCEDGTLPDQEWFRDASDSMNRDIEKLQDRHCPTAAFMDKDVLNGRESPVYFQTDGYLTAPANPDCKIIHGKTYGGCTIACRAYQIACQLGASRIILCGIDMYGSGYYDGSEVAGKFMEERTGNAWESQRDGFNRVIEWAWNEMGIPTVSLSKTTLSVNVVRADELEREQTQVEGEEAAPVAVTNKHLPTVAYLCMCFLPMKTMDILAWVMAQDYPNELKTVYLIHQEPFPDTLLHDLPIEIKEINVPGEWPALWAFKLWAFCAAVTEDVTVMFDQDDCWMPDYTREAIQPLLEVPGHDLAWCYHMRFVQKQYEIAGKISVVSKNQKLYRGGKWRPSVTWGRHQSAIGTLVARTPAFREVVAALKKNHPTGMVETKTGQFSGPIDNYLRRLIQNAYADRLIEHNARGRFYFIHTRASSKFGRRKEGYVDG